MRFEPYATPDDALNDVKRLARSMTFKAAIASLNLGGAKGVIAYEPGPPPVGKEREDALHDFAELVESFEGRYITAQDAGTSLEDIVQVGRFTSHIAGYLRDEGSGDPSPYTAHGVEVAIRLSVGAPLAGRRVVVVGLGHVGSKLAERLHASGATLTIADVDPGKRALAQALDADWVSPSGRSSPKPTCSRRARSAGCSTRTRSPTYRFRWSPEPRTTSSPTRLRRMRCAAAASSGRRTSSSTPVG